MTTDFILKLVCKYYSLTEDEIKAKTRLRYIVRPRQMFFLLVREDIPQISLSKMAVIFGLNHCSAIHGIQKIRQEIELYSEIRNEYIYLKTRLNGRFIPKEKYYGNHNQQICNWYVFDIENPFRVYGKV